MSELLIKLFVKNHDNPTDEGVREKYGVFSSIIGVIVNILLAALKLLVGLLGGSIAIIADALNNFSDAGTSIVSFVSFKIASKPADREHPFGHARIEYVCSMIVSFLILLVGFELFSESVSGLFNSESAAKNFTALTYIVLISSVIMKLWLAFFYRKVAKRIDSTVVKAAATDSFSDAVSTCAVLISTIVVSLTDIFFIDSIVGMAVAVMIFYAGIKILIETKNSLLGEAPIAETVDNIKKTVEKYPEIIGMHDLMVHNYGPNKYIASFHAEVDGKGDIYALHDAIDNLEREISDKLGILCTVHMDPIETDNELVNELKDFVLSTLHTVCPDADIHDFRIVIGPTHTNLIFDVVIPFEVKESPEDIVKKISAKVSDYKPEYYCVITVDRS